MAWDSDARRWHVELAGRNQTAVVICKEIIDCTGGADVVGLLGYERVRGEPDDPDDTQPGTLAFRSAGYDVNALDGNLIHQRFEQATGDGTLQRGDWAYQDRDGSCMGFLRSCGINQMHVHYADDTTADTQTAANIAGRTGMLRLYRFIRSLPGCENAYVEYCKQDTAIRESLPLQPSPARINRKIAIT